MDHQRTRAYYERTARSYDASMRTVERVFLGHGRIWAASLAGGDVLELGIGTGRNIPYYPPGVRLTGVDVSPAMLAIARDRARELQLQIDLREVAAEALPFADGSFDTVVCTPVLCSVVDDGRALQEIARVLRPGGRAILVEHVRSPVWPVRLIQMVLNPLSVRICGLSCASAANGALSSALCCGGICHDDSSSANLTFRRQRGTQRCAGETFFSDWLGEAYNHIVPTPAP